MDFSQLGSLSVAGALVIVIGYLLASNRTDRAAARAEITAMAAAHAVDIGALRTRVSDLEREVDTILDAKRDAENRAAEAERRAAFAEARAAVGHDPASTRLPPPTSA